MTKLVASKLPEIRDLCIKHHVHRLYLFGSGAGADFDPARSDLDFVVKFNPDALRTGFGDDYFQLLAALEELFGRSIDLVEYGAIDNPYFKQSVIETRVPLYAA